MNRRNFLRATALTAGALSIGASRIFGRDAVETATRSTLVDLTGDWQFAQMGQDEWLPAKVPGCVHTDLLAAGKIPDPFYRDTAASLQWIGKTDWHYRRTFQVPANVLKSDRVLLRCEGLDTLAVITVNDHELGRADNMFRVWEFDAKPFLKSGENHIEVKFASPYPLMEQRNQERPMFEWIGSHEPKGRAYVRKEPCSFGWDWGPVLATCGVWRGIGIHAFDEARISNFQVLQDHSPKGNVRLDMDVEAEVVRAGKCSARVSVRHANRLVVSKRIECPEGKGRASLDIHDPKLWWAVGMGAQPLYEVSVELLNADGNVLGRMSKRVGLRVLRLLPPEKDVSLRFEVNGVPFFAKGANMIPTDVFANRVTPEALRRYVADAVAVNMNTLRFWGGGYYEEDELFNLCDEMGVCVWLDFKFACSTYPAFDAGFMENVRREARDQLQRLRHHACIAVWCGNNEISLMTKEKWSAKSMGQADYDKLFKELIGSQVKELAPQANYVSGSPDCGDVHYWKVWHENQPFEIYRTVDGFMSEFGFQSFPHPKTVRAFTSEADRASVLTSVMKWHQRAHDDGNERIRATIDRYFNPPKDFESTIWLSQILQAYGIKMGAEHWRRNMPKSMGCVYWQYNDCWPVASWSSVDYFGRWKALHYLARRFYAPMLVSGVEDAATGAIDIHVTSDRREAARGKLTWEVTDLSGASLTRGSAEVEIPVQAGRLVQKLDLSEQIKQHGAANLLTWLSLEVAGEIISDNLVFFTRPKELALSDPRLKWSVDKSDESYRVTIHSEGPALWVWADLEDVDARYSENFIHLKPGDAATILIQPDKAISLEQATKALRVRSLFDLCLAPSPVPVGK